MKSRETSTEDYSKKLDDDLFTEPYYHSYEEKNRSAVYCGREGESTFCCHLTVKESICSVRNEIRIYALGDETFTLFLKKNAPLFH
jgi:hypothetical protein